MTSHYAEITGQAFNDPEKGYRLANRMYGEGADIIFPPRVRRDGRGPFPGREGDEQAAIGVDIDQSALAPGLVLTSMTKNIDVAVFESVRSFVRGNFSGVCGSLG